MIPLKDKTNVNAPNAVWPYGELRDNPGDNSGTPVNEVLVSDVMQLMEYIMNDGGVVPTGLLDNLTNGFQLADALTLYIRSKQATETLKGTAEIATQAETNAGTDDERLVTPLKLTGFFGAWTSRDNIADITYTVSGIGVTVNVSKLKYKIVGKLMTIIWYAEITNAINPPTAFFILIPASKTANVGFDFYSESMMLDAGAKVESLTKVEVSNNTKIKVFPKAGVTLSNGVTTISGSLTFEIA